jgi:hypothetical protein
MPPCFQQVSLDDGLGLSALVALLLLSLRCLAISVSQTHKCSSMAADLARSSQLLLSNCLLLLPLMGHWHNSIAAVIKRSSVLDEPVRLGAFRLYVF